MKEALENLKEITRVWCPICQTWQPHEKHKRKCLLAQAIKLLEVEPTEFTKIMRRKLDLWDIRGKDSFEYRRRLDAYQALDLIDCLQAENKKLVDILRSEVDVGRSDVDEIGFDEWLAQNLKETGEAKG